MMRRETIYAALPVLLLSTLLMAGCGPGPDTGTDEQQQAEQTRQDDDGQAEEEEGTGGYFGTMNEARRSAKKTAGLSKLQKEVRRFRALKGRNPRSLKELENWRGGALPEPPAEQEYSYDPETGELTLKDTR